MKEVLRSEAGIELTIEDEARPEKQKRKSGVSGRRGRVPLLPAWEAWPGARGARWRPSVAGREWVWGSW